MVTGLLKILFYIMRLPFFLCNKRSRSHRSLGLRFADHIPAHKRGIITRTLPEPLHDHKPV